MKINPKTIERKNFVASINVPDPEGRTITGLASTFGNVDHTDDIVHPGAFTKTIAEKGNNIRLLWGHDVNEPLGKIVKLQEKSDGLFMEAVISDTSRGRDALALLADGAMDGLSIGFTPVKGGTKYTKDKAGNTIRHLKEIKLYEISLVSFPANEEARITSLKDLLLENIEEKEQEQKQEESSEEIIAEQIESKEMTESGPVQRMGDVLQGSVHQTFTNLADSWYVNGMLDRDERINLSNLIGDALDILSKGIPEEVAMRELPVYPLMGLFGFSKDELEKSTEEEVGSEEAEVDPSPDATEDSSSLELIEIERIKNTTIEV